ncbi:MAG: hypothetical protein ACLP1X_28885 [Polyangiaceae bacterium]
MGGRGVFLVWLGLGAVAALDLVAQGCGGATASNPGGGDSGASARDAGVSDTGVADANQAGVSDASADAIEAAGPSIMWGSDVQESATGTAPTVVAGPSSAGATWVCQIHAPAAGQAVWQTELLQGLDSIQPQGNGPLSATGADLPTATALTTTGSIFEMHMQAPTAGTFWWWLGQLDATQTHAVWPNGDTLAESVTGYRPRVASVGAAPGGGVYVVFVYMNSAAAGPLSYYTMQWTGTGDPNDASTVGALAWMTGTPVAYDDGMDQNPAITIAASVAGHAMVVEAHQDASTGLYFRLADLPIGATNPTITWQTGTSQLPGQAQGAHPALAMYKSTILEVHEGTTAGTLMYTLGTVESGGIAWQGPTQMYATGGLAPAIAIDPTSGLGVEVHQSSAGGGVLIQKAFAVH